MSGAGAISIERKTNPPGSYVAWSWGTLDRRTLSAALLVCAGYYLGAKLGFALTFQPHPISVLWPPNSILVAAFLLTRPRVWWIILLAALPAHLATQFQNHVPPAMVFCWFVSNSCEALIGASGVWLLIGQPLRLNRLRNIGTFCLCVVFVGPVLSSFLDAGFVVWNQFGSGSYWEIWQIRTNSNVLAALIIAPLIITWATGARAFVFQMPMRRHVEAALLFLALLLASLSVLYAGNVGQNWLLPYLPLPFLVWAAVRFGSIGASTAIGAIGFLTIWSAAHGHGPFSAGSSEQDALSIQIFLIVLSIPVLFLGTLIEEMASGEIQLRESEKRFQTMADAAPVLLWMAGPDKLCTFFNKGWVEFTGRAMEEQLGECWSEGVHPEDLAECLATYSQAFDAREPFTMQYRLRRHDGEYRCVAGQGAPRFDPNGQFIGYIGSCVDASDLLQKERELNESEERVALAAEAAHLGVWEWDITTNKIWLSDPARKLFQFKPETEITFSILSNRVHPEDRAMREEAIRRAIDTKSDYDIEYRILLPDQTVRWIAGRGRYLISRKSKRGRLLGVSVDVTARKQAEQLFQLAAEGSHLGVWDWDEITGKLLWDGAARKIFGVPVEEEITLDTFYRAIYQHDLEGVKQVWRRAVESGLPYQIEFRIQRSNGSIGWVHARGRGYYDDKGRPLRMIGIVFDITDRKQAEEEARRQRDQINLLGRASLLGEMTTSIAHEINQPLSGIIMNSGTALRYMERSDVDVEQLREMLVDILADGHRAHRVIRNIRETVKKGTALRQPVAVNELVNGVMHMVESDAAVHSCELQTSLDNNLPPVNADPVQLQQVLINLLVNAFDAMDSTPPSRRKVEIKTENGDNTVRVSVRDHGPGIADGAREHIFDQFFTTKSQGIGMGLAIVWSIIEAHSGTITAENVDGEGAQFTFSLPAD